MFRFGMMGCGNIAAKFVRAAALAEDCTVCAAASKNPERARNFAAANGIPQAYGNYEEMLEQEKPDAVYIAVLPSDHARLTALCLRHHVPVLCEKAMFQNFSEAEKICTLSRETGTFFMEAMWSRFLPAERRAEEWVRSGRIGNLRLIQATIGFAAEDNPENRYLNAALGGGTANDILVYAVEIADLYLEAAKSAEEGEGRPRADHSVFCKSAESSACSEGADRLGAEHGTCGEVGRMPEICSLYTEKKYGVDVLTLLTLRKYGIPVQLNTSFVSPCREEMILLGDQGRIEIPHPHYASEAVLYSVDGKPAEHFTDTETQNGFVYEIREVMRCVRAGVQESPRVPHALNLAYGKIQDRIRAAEPAGKSSWKPQRTGKM